MAVVERISQRDIAKSLNLSQITVSRALRGSPMVTKATMTRVRKEAKRMGYEPDPILAGLNAYRQTKRPLSQGQTLAWITPPMLHHAHSWFHGALAQAKRYGYRLEVFQQNDPEISLRHLALILYNRGIRGVIIAPQNHPDTHLDIDLKHLTAITIGYSVQSPAIDRVITDHHHNTMVCFHKLRELGYRRIGMVSSDTTEERIEGRRIGAYKYAHSRFPGEIEIPPLHIALDPRTESKKFERWYRKWTPDSILLHQPLILDLCRDMGLRVPRDVGLVSIAMNRRWNDYAFWAGMDEQLVETGAFAVDSLVSLIRGNYSGISNQRRVYLLEGCWKAGRTITPHR